MLDVEAAELAFAQSVAAVRTDRDLVEAVGPDAASFLQGQLSQDVEGLAVGASAPSLLLQPQGKVDAWLRVTRLASDRFWLDVDAGHGEAVLARLQRFKLRVDLTLELTAGVPTVAVRGPGAAGGAAALGIVVPDGVVEVGWVPARAGTTGFDLIGMGVELPATVPLAPPGALEVLRISLGLPAMGSELDGTTIPAAAGVVEESASFTKGCYVGQELVARVDSRGSNTPTRLRGVLFGSGAPVDVGSGAAVMAGGDEVGRLTSVAPWSRRGPIGLAYLKRSVPVPSEAEVVDGAGHRIPVQLSELPLSELPLSELPLSEWPLTDVPLA